MAQQRCRLVTPLHPLKRRSVRGIGRAPSRDVLLELGRASALQTGDPIRSFSAPPIVIGLDVSHDWSVIPGEAVDHGNRLAHLLLDPLYTEPGALGDFGIAQTIKAMRQKNLPSFWAEPVHRGFEPVQAIAALKHISWIGTNRL